MNLRSLRPASQAHVTTLTLGHSFCRRARPSGHETTFANVMRPSGTPASVSTLMAVQAEPPVASMGSHSRTLSEAMSGGSLEYMRTGSAVSSSRWMRILAVLAAGTTLRTASCNIAPERMMSTRQIWESGTASSVPFESGPQGVSIAASTLHSGSRASASSASMEHKRSAARTYVAWSVDFLRTVVRSIFMPLESRTVAFW
mmetsp:Transcript_22441/g.67354  ORF Transcript_22441/g.67354 Transcript_22441/m.67354 type:complete len:201 (+) Transcript_22441:113-715(+)